MILSPRACSGDMYATVPTIAPVRVAAFISSAACSLATPKSSTLSRSVPSWRRQTNRFCGLRSRWMIPAACATCDPARGLRHQVGGARDRQRAPRARAAR